MKLDEIDIAKWKAHEVTKRLYQLINEAITMQTNALTNGDLLNIENFDRKYSYAVGFLDGLKLIINSDLMVEEDSDEIFRHPESQGS